MPNYKYQCPKHHLTLRTVEDYPGALVCPAGSHRCPALYTVIGGHLCVSDGVQWHDVETGELRVPPKDKDDGITKFTK